MSTTAPWLVFNPATCRIKSDTPHLIDGKTAMCTSDVSNRDGREWISHAEAAQLAGCATSTIEARVADGTIKHRPQQGLRPSLDRASVEQWATAWNAARKQATAARQARDQKDHPMTDTSGYPSAPSPSCSAARLSSCVDSPNGTGSRPYDADAAGGSDATTSSNAPQHASGTRHAGRPVSRNPARHHEPSTPHLKPPTAPGSSHKR